MTPVAPTMPRLVWPEGVGPLAGAVGAGAMGAASAIAALGYTGSLGEAYSPFNHWVSELGEVGVSPLATVFNLGLIAGGLGFGTFMMALSVARGGRLGSTLGALGLASGAFGALVGVFPLGQSDLHVPVAAGFFVLGALAVALASADIARRPDAASPAWLAAVGAIVVACFVGFIAISGGRADASLAEARPVFMLEPTLEWGAVLGTLAWTALVAATWWRGRGSGTGR